MDLLTRLKLQFEKTAIEAQKLPTKAQLKEMMTPGQRMHVDGCEHHQQFQEKLRAKILKGTLGGVGTKPKKSKPKKK